MSEIDVTFMYAVHDAFQRDLERLAAMAEGGDASGAAVEAGWERFKAFLHVHHTAEDTHLWPVLRAKGASPAVLDRMEDEHAGLEALLDAVGGAVAAGAAEQLADAARLLADELGDHCEHEEQDALPLVKELLTVQEWKAFGAEQRHQVGSPAMFFPWLLDGADPGMRRRVFDAVPPPVRVLHRFVWSPRYRRAPRWHAPLSA
ncbi:hemerythrin domain-containing protein [Actinomadura litoris]|uniref:Hemerythrin domain-containing protein n=1 Tax=Actinomadura litoris TaxID=2678616 RepID=A0A7K1L5U2_9ACTN|nr:hemerythrin domain-containing protein [Actinomadura litoris]MUN39794.1 hemerythrin domain-containing protein [Actinomadura litoris]